MQQYNVSALCDLMTAFGALETVLKALRVKSRGDPLLDADIKSGLLDGEFEKAATLSAEITFMDCTSHVRRLIDACKEPDITVGMAEVEVRHAKEDIVSTVSKWRFVPISPSYAQYFEQEWLFSAEVHEAFKEARNDIRESGNCIAVGSPTAAVFHLMRVAEFGLRALAKKLRVKLTNKGKTHPIELADWEQVLGVIRPKIETARKTVRSNKRLATIELYSDAADHCTFMKDIWRNNISHTRKPYNLQEAVSITGRVLDFMRFMTQKSMR